MIAADRTFLRDAHPLLIFSLSLSLSLYLSLCLSSPSVLPPMKLWIPPNSRYVWPGSRKSVKVPREAEASWKTYYQW
jgi:hypothetical protein